MKTFNVTSEQAYANVTGIIGNRIVDLRKVNQYGFEYILYGYFMPVWASLSILVYTLMITVFIKNKMTSKTHVCLIALAICDSSSPIAPTVTWAYFFAIRRYYYYLPFDWCRTYHYTTQIIPQIFGYSSFFITIMLAVQRYIVVAYPLRTKQLCTSKIVYCMLVCCFLLSTIGRFMHFFDYKYKSITVPKLDNRNETMQACILAPAEWIPISFIKYLGIFTMLQTIVFGILPCIVLVVCEILMLKAVNNSLGIRQHHTGNNNARHAQRERRLTIATILITAVALLYMIPVVAVQSIGVLSSVFDVKFENHVAAELRTTVVVVNVTYWMCIPSNFLITCCLSEELRRGIKHFLLYLCECRLPYPRALSSSPA